MAGADRLLTPVRPLSILACAPLPYRVRGAPAAQVGVAIFYTALLPRLAALGHRVRVLAEAPPAAADAGRSGIDWPLAGVEVDWFAFPYWPGRRPLDAEYDARVGAVLARRLAEHVSRARPDLVLVGRESVAPAAADACAALGLPGVLIAHGVTTAALRSDDYPRAAAARVLDGVRRMQHVVAVARHLEAALRALGVGAVTTIPNRADTDAFRPAAADADLRAALGIAPRELVVGHVSNLTDHKRAGDLVAAAPRVLRALPHTVFLIVGDGVERAALAAQAAAAGIGARVRFVGEIDHREMPRHLALCDVVVMPSQRETAALVYRETQACGRVLLASDIAAAREAVVDGETGVLFRRGDADDLAARLLDLLGDPARRQRIGAAARRAALTQSPDAWVRAYDAVLQGVVSK